MFSSIFSRCQACTRIYRAASSPAADSRTCRNCRDEQELSLFFEWLDTKL